MENLWIFTHVDPYQSDVPWPWPQLETAAGQSGDGNTDLQGADNIVSSNSHIYHKYED